jgi:hypothetical protein
MAIEFILLMISTDGHPLERVSLDDSQGVEVEEGNGTSEVVGGEEGNCTTRPSVEGVVYVSAVDLTVVTECHSKIDVEVELAPDHTLEGGGMRGVDCLNHVDALRCKGD